MEKSIDFVSLEEALDYKDESIVHRFLDMYKITKEEAEDLFEETKKWMWISAKVSTERKRGEKVPYLSIDSSLYMLDEMWHNFILFTREYQAYCEKNFGFFLHHAPTTYEEHQEFNRQLRENREETMAEYENELKEQYAYIYEHLGRETLIKWYEEYPKKYSAKKMNSLRKKY